MPATVRTAGAAAPLPQVGAVLLLNDTKLTKDHLCGSIDWILGGSAVVVDWNRFLTIEHAVFKGVPKALFLPWEGIVPFPDSSLDPEDERRGDDLVLATLERPLAATSPMRHRKIAFRQKSGSFGWTFGYGRWKGLEPDRGSAGLQRTVPVTFGYEPYRRQDNLDMSWYGPDNHGRQARGGNSGGPMCWRAREQGYRFVSITRESRGGLTIGSWIGRERDGWLRRKLGQIDNTLKSRQSRSFQYLELDAAAKVATATFDLPDWTSRADVTLNGTENHLQLAIARGKPNKELRRAARSHRHAGQFLARRFPEQGGLAGDLRRLSVAVSYVGRADKAIFPIRLQLCVLAR